MADAASISAFVASWFTPSSLFLFVNLVIGTIALTSRLSTPNKPTNQNHPHEFGPHAHDGIPQLARSSSLLERFRSFHYGLYKHDTPFSETEHLQPVENSPPPLVRTPSLLERVKSFQFGFYNYEPTVAETVQTEPVPPDNPIQPQLARNPSLLERLKSMNFSSLYRSDSMKAEREGEGEDERQGSNSGNLVKRSKSKAREESPARLPETMRKSASEKASSSRRSEEDEEEVATVERRRPESARVWGERETASLGEDEAVDAKADDFINRFKQQLRLQRLNSILRYREVLKEN